MSVDDEYSVDLAIFERLIERGSGSCLMRTMIECSPTQDDHVTVDARLVTLAKSEFVQVQRSGGLRETEDYPSVRSIRLPRNAA